MQEKIGDIDRTRAQHGADEHHGGGVRVRVRVTRVRVRVTRVRVRVTRVRVRVMTRYIRFIIIIIIARAASARFDRDGADA